MEILGWIGSILFTVCALPQTIQVWRKGNADGLDWFFLLAWFFGELFTLAYISPKGDIPLIANYAVNLVFLTVILKFKIWPRE